MLPVDVKWYRRLLIFSIAIGVATGVFVLIYSGLTAGVSGFIIDSDSANFGSGQIWWIPLISLAGLLVAFLRRYWNIPKELPGPIEMANRAWIDVKTAPQLVVLAATSMMLGASLGPSFGLVVGGGGMGSWLVTRFKFDDEEAKREYTLTGMSGALGGAFSAPMLGAVLTSELAPTPKKNYVAAFLPALIAATICYAIFWGITGTTMLEVYSLPEYEFSFGHIPLSLLLGFIAAVVALVFTLIMKLIARVAPHIKNPLLRGMIGGASVGLIAFLFPLSASSGNTQLAFATDNMASISFGLLVAILLAKMFAVAISQEAGFIGGVVFPIIFLGGIAGLAVHSAIPEIPVALAVAALIAAVPGATLGAPVSMVLIGAGSVGIGIEAFAPVALSVATSHILISFVVKRMKKQQDAAA